MKNHPFFDYKLELTDKTLDFHQKKLDKAPQIKRSLVICNQIFMPQLLEAFVLSREKANILKRINFLPKISNYIR